MKHCRGIWIVAASCVLPMCAASAADFKPALMACSEEAHAKSIAQNQRDAWVTRCIDRRAPGAEAEYDRARSKRSAIVVLGDSAYKVAIAFEGARLGLDDPRSVASEVAQARAELDAALSAALDSARGHGEVVAAINEFHAEALAFIRLGIPTTEAAKAQSAKLEAQMRARRERMDAVARTAGILHR